MNAASAMPRFPYLRKFVALPRERMLLLVEATVWLTLARMVLKAVPFPRIGRRLGALRPPSPPLPVASDAERERVRAIGWAVNAAGSHLPLEMVCLPRALAGWQMLHRRGIRSRLHFGALRERSDANTLETHAWLTTPGVKVTGFPVAYGCVELGYFARPGSE